MPRQTVTQAPTPERAVLFSKNVPTRSLQGAVSAQDYNKRTTATRPMRGGRSLSKGRR
jgi:hypothetical protein